MKKVVFGRMFATACLMILAPVGAWAHCDGMDGPVVKAAQKALETENPNLVLIWVQKDDESAIKQAFDQTMSVRKLSPEAKELADRYFFETLVRLHRAGEGAPYTGLKPAGRDLGPAIPATDKAIADGTVDPVVKLIAGETEQGIREHFQHLMGESKYAIDDVAAGREFVAGYVTFLHYVERLYQDAKNPPQSHATEPAEAEGHED